MNIPENIIQAVADAAFKELNIIYLASDPLNGECQADCRRAVIQHALSNPALAPFLSGGIGEYTDEELAEAASQGYLSKDYLGTPRWLRAFLAALPRRESPALAEAIARAEKAEKELSAQLGILRLPPTGNTTDRTKPFGSSVSYTMGIATVTFAPDAENRQLTFSKRGNEPWRGIERYTLHANSFTILEVDADMAEGLDKIVAKHLAR